MTSIRKFPWFVLAMLVIVQAAEAQVLRVTAQRVHLRKEPTTASPAVATVTEGTMLEVVKASGPWYLVDVLPTGDVGYIHRVLVEVVERPGATSQAPAERPASPAPAPQPPPADQPAAVPPAPRTAPPAESYARTQSMEQPADRGLDFTLWGGLLDFAGSNLSGGGALSFLVGGPSAEVEVGGEYTRLGSASADFSSSLGPSASVSGSANLITANGSFNYNFLLPQARLVPYASAGLVWARSSGTVTASIPVFGLEEKVSTSSTETAFQFGGGLKVPVGDAGKYFRGDVRFNLFDGDTATRVFVGVVF